MAYTMQGRYAATCNCQLLCGCPVDAPPTGPDGTCTGVAIFELGAGSNLDATDLAGVSFALYNYFPSNITSGNWKIAVAIDEGASNAQADAIGRIMSGQEGGPLAEFVPLIAENLGVTRTAIELTGGDSPHGRIGTETSFEIEPVRGVDGSPTTVKNSMFGFSPEYVVGRAKGTYTSLGSAFSASYGEAADFVFSTEAPAAVKGRA